MNRLSLRLPWIFSLHQARPYSSLRDDRSNAIPLLVSSFHSVGRLGARKRDNFSFSSKAPLLHPQEGNKGGEKVENAKRKTRSSAAKNSLRRVAVEAQRSRDGKQPQKAPAAPFQSTSKVLMSLVHLFTRLIQLVLLDCDRNVRGGRI